MLLGGIKHSDHMTDVESIQPYNHLSLTKIMDAKSLGIIEIPRDLQSALLLSE